MNPPPVPLQFIRLIQLPLNPLLVIDNTPFLHIKIESDTEYPDQNSRGHVPRVEWAVGIDDIVNDVDPECLEVDAVADVPFSLAEV